MQKYRITLSDGTQHVVQQNLVDKVAAETYFRNNKRLGTIGDNPFRSTAFMAWSAAKRARLLDVTWEQFLDGTDAEQLHALDVEFYDDTEDDAEEVEGLGEGGRPDPHVS